MKILLTGGSGFLGGRLLQLLLQRGFTVRLLVRKSRKERSFPPQVEVFYGDVCNMESVLEACKDCDVAIHTAALVEAWSRDFQEFEKVNVGGLKNMIEGLRKTPSLKRLIYSSSFFALGPTDGFIGNENQIHPGNNFCTEYERTKWMADGIARKSANEEGLPLVIVYPGVIYGPGALTSGNLISQMVTDHIEGRFPGYIGTGTSLCSYVYIDDVCEGIISAIEKGKIGQSYLLVGENSSFVNLFQIVETLTGKTPPGRHIPFPVASIIGFFSVLAAYVGGPNPIITHKSINVFKHDWVYTCDATKNELGYKFRSLKEGLKDTLLWLNETGKIKCSVKPNEGLSPSN